MGPLGQRPVGGVWPWHEVVERRIPPAARQRGPTGCHCLGKATARGGSGSPLLEKQHFFANFGCPGHPVLVLGHIAEAVSGGYDGAVQNAVAGGNVISTSDFKKGFRFEHENAPWQVLEFTVHNPSARGAATLVKVKARNLVSSQVLQLTFKAGETFQEPDLLKQHAQFLFDQGDEMVFMDLETFEQYAVSKDMLGETTVWMKEGFEIDLLRYNGEIIQIELPQSVEATVVTVEGGARGDTASGKVNSKAWLENGVQIEVPTYVREGSRVKVDPRSCEFLGRL